MQSGMDKFCIHALESLLRGSDWESKFRTFYFTVCPRFKSYIESSIINDGTGYDLLMFDAYKDFLAFFDLNIQRYLDEMGVTLSTLGESLFSRLVENDSSAMNLRDQLEMYGDFDKFSMIMRTKFQETFLNQKLTGDANSGNIGGTIEDNSSITECETVVFQGKPVKATGPARSRAVRVLWDIENIMVSRDIGGLNTLTRLNDFLRNLGLLGPGIDCRISAFFAPLGGKISEAVVRELDKGAVELIWVSSKREDADRKLGLRINQEMMVLPHTETTFVIISSDQDFRHYYQLLNSAGYEVIVVHNAGPGPGAKWVKVLEMHAHRAFRWCDIMNGAVKSRDETVIEGQGQGQGQGQVDVVECVNGNGEEESMPIQCDEKKIKILTDKTTRNGSRRGSDKEGRMNISYLLAADGQIVRERKRKKKKSNVTNIKPNNSSVCVLKSTSSIDRLTPSPPTDDEQITPSAPAPIPASVPAPVPVVEIGWVEGTVLRWRGTFGFLAVHPADFTPTAPCSAVLSLRQAGGDPIQKGGIKNRDGDTDGDGKCLTTPIGSAPLPVERCTAALRVYVHYKSLHFDPPVLLLRRGERVRVYLEYGSRGYFAGRVEPLILDSLPLPDVEKINFST